jgi:hypothetical protein
MEGGSPGHWGRNTNEGPTPAPNRTSTGLNRTPRMLRYRIHCRGAGGSTNGKEARIDFGSRSLSAHRLTVYRPRPLRCKLATGDAPACRLALYQQEHRNGGLSPLHRRVAGIDVHRMLHVVTVLIEQPDGSVVKHSREFGYFKRDCRALAAHPTEHPKTPRSAVLPPPGGQTYSGAPKPARALHLGAMATQMPSTRQTSCTDSLASTRLSASIPTGRALP